MSKSTCRSTLAGLYTLITKGTDEVEHVSKSQNIGIHKSAIMSRYNEVNWTPLPDSTARNKSSHLAT